jgi:hypothetical protein
MMGEHDSRSGSNAGVVILIALLVLGIPCCGGAALLGLGAFSFHSVSRPVPVQPPLQIQPMPAPVIADEVPPPVESTEPPPPAPSDAPTESPPNFNAK